MTSISHQCCTEQGITVEVSTILEIIFFAGYVHVLSFYLGACELYRKEGLAKYLTVSFFLKMTFLTLKQPKMSLWQEILEVSGV